MAKNKHEHLIKPLSIGAIKGEEKGKQGPPGIAALGPGIVKNALWLNGRDHLEGLNVTFSWGVHNQPGGWHPRSKMHAHPYAECLFFVGLDTANIKYLGAEIECCLGDERETYTFNEPTVIVLPSGLLHGSITTRRLFSPKGFGFFAAALGDAFSITLMEESPVGGPAASSRKYAHLVKSLKSSVITERGNFIPSRLTAEQLARYEESKNKTGFKTGPGNADHLVWMSGEDLGGMNLNIAWGFFSQPGIWQRGVGAHTHPADEIMIFLGTDPEKDDSLGAEIEIDLGKEHERCFFDKPSAVVCPAGFPHAPIVTRWVDKPFAFISINLASDGAMIFE
jgi:hypothetical protein